MLNTQFWSLKQIFLVITLSLVTTTASAWVQFIGPAIEVIGIGLSIYDVNRSDELSDKARAEIERTLKRQLDQGLLPLHAIDARTREILGAQGRIELGIDQLLNGQGELSAKLDQLTTENRDGHALTQRTLDHMMKAELSAGLRNLNDAVQMFKQDPKDGVARQTIST